MKSSLFLLPALIAFGLASCSNQDNFDTGNAYSGYDTSNPYGVADAGQAQTAAADPTYDMPAAYEDNATPSVPAPTPAPKTVKTTKPTVKHTTVSPVKKKTTKPAPVKVITTSHTVVKGDSLSKIASKYHVSVASIKQANHLKSDTIMLGSKLTIPRR